MEVDLSIFSIIVPIYNVEKYIRKSLDSIKAQTFTDFEVLCVDDCGTDNSIKIVNEYCKKDSRFKIIKMEKNSGVSAARNAALNIATGKYIVFVDPDDWIEKQLLKKVDSAFKKSDADAVWFNSYHYDNNKKTKKLVYEGNRQNIEGELIGVLPNKIGAVTGCIWDKAFKSEYINKINLRFPEGLIIEDDEFSFKYFVKYQFIYRVNTPLYYYRSCRQGSYVDSNKIKILEDSIKIYSRMLDWAIDEGILNDYREALLSLFLKRINEIKKFNGDHLLEQAQELENRIRTQNSFKFTI